MRALCDRCVAERFAQLREVASRRGAQWAETLAKEIHREQPWPGDSDMLLAVARCKVADLARDARLLDQLASEVASSAASCWARSRR